MHLQQWPPNCPCVYHRS